MRVPLSCRVAERRRLPKRLLHMGSWNKPFLFRTAATLTRSEGALHAAEFAFPAHASIRQVLAILRTAHPVEHHLTIPEGLTAQQIGAVLASAEAMTGEVHVVDEGSLLPQTYDYSYGADRASHRRSGESSDGPGTGRGLGRSGA